MTRVQAINSFSNLFRTRLYVGKDDAFRIIKEYCEANNIKYSEKGIWEKLKEKQNRVSTGSMIYGTGFTTQLLEETFDELNLN